ncbi:multidrug effflux MFS transporter [Streptomyces coelicoflavus]|uniref:Multidrug effflux MFS transporter n=1 Tax=Streptomyces coelicoflavus TaxID=285562 RepID=A0A7K3PVI8_9ACTN|nr:multidrug effflux MFS transporter [Streptomyces coelicoflavus]NEB13963.1 multidrug effflux MFS transporter [Streptomyces coelicoflavus]
MENAVGIRAGSGGGAVRRICVLMLLAALTALGPLSMDAYIPGLPRIADSLHSPAWVVQLTVTACLAGLAIGQLLAGPLSDALGRRGPLLFGLTLCTAAGALCALAPNVWLLVVLRGMQGLGGAFALVIAYAYVSDLHEGKAAARYFSLLTLVTGLAPVLAPLMGAQILDAWGWRAVFVTVAAFSALVLVACVGALPESRPPRLRPPWEWRRTGSVYGGLLRDRALVGPVLANALTFAVMFAYISGSPFVLQSLYGLSPQQYSLVFAVNAIGLVAAAAAGGALVGRFGAAFLLRAGVTGTAAASVVLLVLAVAGLGLWPILTALFVAIAHVGLVLPNAPALALRHRGSNAGAAAALLGCGQFLFGGLAAPLVGLTTAHSAVPMATVMAVLGLATSAVSIIVTPAGTAGSPIRTSGDQPYEEVHHDHGPRH